jgi:hypothetical protein
MILLESILHNAIGPALALLPPAMDSAEARVMLLACGAQESRFMFRFQKVAGQPYVKGPAKGFWQFERGGGVLGVLMHDKTKFIAKEACAIRNVAPNSHDVWAQIETDDVLAAAFARLLLWTDSQKLPACNDAKNAWELYLRTWRPGRPHPETWSEFHATANAQVMA